MFRIEPGRPEDLGLVREISGQVFSEYGDYGEVLPRFFATQGVHSFVAWEATRAVGYLLIGFLPWSGGEQDQEWWLADLLAVAVTPDRQRQGVGRHLLERALQLVAEMAGWRDIKRIELTCAATNQAALDFFAQHGFEVIDPHHGTYSGGQPAQRLAREVAGPDR
jgi:ribosomal protein S18 acetylase RimI-like enzyme